MGFKGRVLYLRWPEGHVLHEMQVDIRATSVIGMEEMGEGRREGETNRDAKMRRLALLCKHVVSWNLEHPDTGEPLARTPEALDEFDGGAVIEIIDDWTDKGRIPSASKAEDPDGGKDREPADPLAVTSDGGLPSGASSEVEASIPTQAV